jgi:hypothetical protein
VWASLRISVAFQRILVSADADRPAAAGVF